VPGLRVAAKREHSSPSDRRTERELARCVGLTGTSPIVEAGSPDFERASGISHFDVSSNVSVAQSASLAAHELRQLRSVRAKGCLKRYLAVLLNGALSNATIGPVSIQQGTPPAADAGGSVGLRISTSITVHAIPIPFYLDILDFVSGTAQVSLMSTGVPVPFPAATQQRLFLALLARAKAHHP
jgi:hypothetical protein